MRVSGFYWVVFDGVEQVAYWSDMFGCWHATGPEEKLFDADMDKIDERRITRGE